jgi:hypothetical protein
MKIGFVKGAGNTTVINEYQFTDKSFSGLLNYYRLRQIDFDGTEKFSSIIAIRSAQNNTAAILNNPFQDKLMLLMNNDYDEVTMSLFDVNGKKIAGQTAFRASGIFEWRLPYLPSGMYLVKIKSGDQVVVLKAFRK